MISGNVDLYMSSVPTLLGQIKQGKLRPLAVTSAKRVDDLPDVPTINESGYKGFDAVTWFGLLAPAGTPQGRHRQAECRVQQGAASSPTCARGSATKAPTLPAARPSSSPR